MRWWQARQTWRDQLSAETAASWWQPPPLQLRCARASCAAYASATWQTRHWRAPVWWRSWQLVQLAIVSSVGGPEWQVPQATSGWSAWLNGSLRSAGAGATLVRTVTVRLNPCGSSACRWQRVQLRAGSGAW